MYGPSACSHPETKKVAFPSQVNKKILRHFIPGKKQGFDPGLRPQTTTHPNSSEKAIDGAAGFL